MAKITEQYRNAEKLYAMTVDRLIEIVRSVGSMRGLSISMGKSQTYVYMAVKRRDIRSLRRIAAEVYRRENEKTESHKTQPQGGRKKRS